MSEVENCRLALEKLEAQWPGANKCKELLIELSQNTRESLAKNGKGPKRFAPSAAAQAATAIPSENANTVVPSHRGFSVAPTTPKVSQTSSSGSARQSISPRSSHGSNGGTFSFNSPTGFAVSNPPLPSSPPAQSHKRQREETPEPRSPSKRPTHRPQLSAPGNIQGLALSNVSGGAFAPFLGPQVPVYQTQGAWQQQVHPPIGLPLDTDPSPFVYSAGLSPLSRMVQFATNGAAGNELPMFDVNASPPYDINALPPFSGMTEMWTNFGGEGENMDLWSTMPDAFNGAPPTVFGLGEEGLLNINGETGGAP